MDAEGASEKGAGFIEVSASDQGADAAGGYGRAADDQWVVGADGEVQVAAEGSKVADVGLGIVAEAEGLAFVDFSGLEGGGKDTLCKIVGGPLAERVVEGEDEGEVDSGLGEEV